jgi:hypothetical protein
MNKYFQFPTRKKRPCAKSASKRLRLRCGNARAEVKIFEVITTLFIFWAFIGSLMLLFGFKWALVLLIILPLL